MFRFPYSKLSGLNRLWIECILTRFCRNLVSHPNFIWNTFNFWMAKLNLILGCLLLFCTLMFFVKRSEKKEKKRTQNVTLTYDTMTWITFRRWLFKGSGPTTWSDVSRAHERRWKKNVLNVCLNTYYYWF